MANGIDLLNPLNKEQKDQVKQGIKMAEETIAGIKKAQSAGIDTGDQLTTAIKLRDQLVQIKRTYFPNEA